MAKVVTYAMLGHLWDVVEDGLVGVTRSVVVVLGLVVGDSTDDSGVSVLEGGVSAELSTFLLIGVFFSHFDLWVLGVVRLGMFPRTKIQIIFFKLVC